MNTSQNMIDGLVVNPPSLQELLESINYVILDTNVIISALEKKATHIFDLLEKYNVKPIVIQAVHIELLATQNDHQRAERQQLLIENEVTEIPLEERMYQDAKRIQQWCASVNIYPEPTDLYLGAALAKYTHSKTMVLTGNLKDFPHPLFTREGYLIMQDYTKVKTLCFLSFNHEELG